ncbi:MAG: SRPBCC domain-containing protein [Bacteroidota bacterium]|nr:SRPBCC domain-containing protein [Bacteroidota bacterium]MDX5431328.1 SRPBCC domain-containing protein [Bacteroidota bacterium]MDX5470066.1 SRPBCC domain-containing protein [Bacteroidota bacterium]
MSKIHVSAQVNQPIQEVWTHYTAPSFITQWNFAHESWCCPTATNDLRVGGRFNYRMEARDGSFGFDFEGTYLEIEPYSKIIYQMDDERKAIIQFMTEGNITRVTIDFDAEHQNPEEMQRQGWQAILDQFKKVSEAQ